MLDSKHGLKVYFKPSRKSNDFIYKVNSEQEACAKCFAVHLSKYEILQTTWKSKTNNIKLLNRLVKNEKLRVWCSLFHFFHVICKVSNFNMWTVKHLAQASCTELTLPYTSDTLLFWHHQNPRRKSPIWNELTSDSKKLGQCIVVIQYWGR